MSEPSQSVGDKLRLHQVIPHVLPFGIDIPSSNLIVKWPNTTLDSPGKQLDLKDVLVEPKLYVEPSVSVNRKHQECK
jgi:hypothetical protein